MELSEALDVVVAQTGHARYRQLCDPGHPDYHPGYVRIVMAMATGREPEAATPGPTAHVLPLAGDLAAVAIKRFGGDRLARYIEAKTGKPCNCDARRLALNALDAKLRRFLGW